MKLRTFALCIALLFPFVAANQGTAQEAETGLITRAVIATPMPGMRAAYEEGLKRHHQWHREHKDTWTYNVWQIVSGPGTGNYVHATNGHHWADFDQSRYDAQAHNADAAENHWKYRAGSETRYWALNRSLSTIRERNASPAMVMVNIMKVVPGKSSLLASAMREIREARDQVGKSRESYVYWLANSGSWGTYMMVLPRENWADFDGPRGENRAALTQVHGEVESRLIMNRFSEAEVSINSAVYLHRPDLSYNPDK